MTVTTEPPAFPMRRTCPFNPPPQYAEMRETGAPTRVTLAGGGTAWLITRYEDVKAVLMDPRLSSDRTRPGYPFLTDDAAYLAEVRVFPGMDSPDHQHYRRMFIKEFTARRIRELRPEVERIVAERLDTMERAGGPVDLVTALALPVPSLVIARLLGVPEADRPRFLELTELLLTGRAVPAEGQSADEAEAAAQERGQEAFRELLRFMRELVKAKRAEPTEDLLGRVAAEHVASGALDEWELVITAMLLLFAGYETTANMIALGTAALLSHPDQLALLKDSLAHDDGAILPSAVEELLRHLSIAELATARTALEDMEVGGVLIRAGEGVIPLAAAANRDPAAFADADRLDLRRTPNRHFAFGHGAHQCLAQTLARMELEVVFGALFRRFPDLRLAVPLDEVPFAYDAVLHGAYALPVTW
ncbi:cytochrome P450 [Streptomyces sp. NPDC001262]|uniref:cytochrome P450 n=1 Tax=Streptomyces TaxID=1883 RepID=UPI0036B3039D